MRFPSIKEVAAALRDLNANVECDEDGCDVRLQVYESPKWEHRAEWALRWGDSQYDQDHRGYWGSSSVPGVVGGVERRFDSRAVARDLIEQCKEMHATSGDE